MTSLHDVVETEIYKAPTGLYEDTAQQYAGWWYCVIPTATIEREGLPLPLFVRSDDAEYALRCKPKFMSMVFAFGIIPLSLSIVLPWSVIR